jgi:hypothetical protein
VARLLRYSNIPQIINKKLRTERFAQKKKLIIIFKKAFLLWRSLLQRGNPIVFKVPRDRHLISNFAITQMFTQMPTLRAKDVIERFKGSFGEITEKPIQP